MDMAGIVATVLQESTVTAPQASATTEPQESVLATATLDSTRTITQEPTNTAVMTPRPMFFNLAVKSKAVYQPNFRFRRWLEDEKKSIPDGEQESISDIETHLPPLKGQGASVINYMKELERVERRLLEFYSGSDDQYNRHVWDTERARHAEYQLLADRLFNIVGGSLGAQRDPSNPVLIGIGLGKFATRSGLSSLHSTFLEYFIQMARSLGYVVVGLNEYYTSKKCPGCGLFVAQVDMRRFYCSHCHVYHHRDVMAAENMANIVHGYLLDQERPDYLQPVASDGSLPWKAKRDDKSSSNSSSSGTTSTATTSTATTTITATTGSASSTVTNSTTNSANPTKGRRKRTATTSSVDEQRPEKASRN
ncbi:hypothetical protein BGX30_000181 [Mortierella sp. GBA39]|nr:hypothetical protein BGX30_000181 [Mortierella sp. GBA39]